MHGQVSDVVLRTADKDLRTSDETVLPNLTNDIILLQFAHLYANLKFEVQKDVRTVKMPGKWSHIRKKTKLYPHN